MTIPFRPMPDRRDREETTQLSSMQTVIADEERLPRQGIRRVLAEPTDVAVMGELPRRNRRRNP